MTEELIKLEKEKDLSAVEYFTLNKEISELRKKKDKLTKDIDVVILLKEMDRDRALLRFESATINYFKAKHGIEP